MYICIYVYIHMCVCVCVCSYIQIHIFLFLLFIDRATDYVENVYILLTNDDILTLLWPHAVLAQARTAIVSDLQTAICVCICICI